jgi:tRNA A37 threonylcarbamoyladenosine dehydratase
MTETPSVTAAGAVTDASSLQHRRFGGVRRLFGATAHARIQAARIAVIGVGGVGSWAVEALARSGVGFLQLIDLDHVAESNLNRQLHALGSTLGAAKTALLAARIADINPACRVDTREEFVSAEAPGAHLAPGLDWVIDCTDDYRVKAALVAWCRRERQRLVTVGAAGGMLDPTRIRVCDLARAEQDSLLARVRKKLRQDYGFSRNLGRRMEVPCVFSMEAVAYAVGDGEQPGRVGGGLACSGALGSLVAVTGAMGFAAAAHVLREVAAGRGHRARETSADEAPARDPLRADGGEPPP